LIEKITNIFYKSEGENFHGGCAKTKFSLQKYLFASEKKVRTFLKTGHSLKLLIVFKN